jgi:uncharacterized lipoprotein YehR (DUF1307 family)
MSTSCTPVSSVAVSILVAIAVSACGTTTPSTTTTPSAPDSVAQKKVRTDLEQCDIAAGKKAHGVAVTPDGKYSFQVTGIPAADAILACMTSKGYSGVRMDNPMDHGGREMIRSGGEGQALR